MLKKNIFLKKSPDHINNTFMYNKSMSQNIPTVLVFSGLDPSGGAGIQADIEALGSQGCHACPIITALTIQDTHDVHRVVPVDADLVLEQAQTLLDDIQVAAIKIGLVSDIRIIKSIHQIISSLDNIPVIFDPVLASGANTTLNSDTVREAIKKEIIPLTTILTPNSLEARLLAPDADDLDDCATSLLNSGCEFVLITGAHEPTEHIYNTLYNDQRKLEQFQWPRLEGEHHGSGCTLASSIAGLIAQGKEPLTAIHEAQEYSWQSLKNAYQIGRGQLIPNRFFWAK